MQFVTTTDQSSGKEIKLRYQEHGSGQPIVFIHGWPLSGDVFEYTFEQLSRRGFRCIAYDRRGFGFSSKVGESYDYDTLAADLDAVMNELDLRDAILLGFSMGGGEVARYIGTYGEDRLAGAVFVSSVTPYMLDTDDHDGVDWSVFQGMIDGLRKDHPGFIAQWAKQFYGVGLLSNPVSDEMLAWTASMASLGSLRATVDCVTAFGKTDFRGDINQVTVPTLIIHGKDDKIVPIDVSAERTHDMIKGSTLLRYDGAPHGLFYTHMDRFNEDLMAFAGRIK
jgi:pimeloyl-ACP methyl ester carboxylesterase